jgi:hypothetical protein
LTNKNNSGQKSNFRPIKNNRSYIGRTYKVHDNDLPHKNAGSGKIVNVAIIVENGKRLGGVRTTTCETKSAKKFNTPHPLYKGYKTFFETTFQNGDYITAKDKRLMENVWQNNLSADNVTEIRRQIFEHSLQSKTNREKRNELKTWNKKSRH